MNTTSKRIRAILRRSSEPLTANDLAIRLSMSHTAISACLRRMPDAYVSGWGIGVRGQPVMEWAVVVPPKDAPRPRSVK